MAVAYRRLQAEAMDSKRFEDKELGGSCARWGSLLEVIWKSALPNSRTDVIFDGENELAYIL